jgi:WD40 repeat protein
LETSIDKVRSRDTPTIPCDAGLDFEGLSSKHLSTKNDLTRGVQEGNPITSKPADYFFGPEPFDVRDLQNRDEPEPEPPVAPEARDRVTNGHPVETGKMTHKETNGEGSMEVDEETESKPGSPIPDHLDGDGDVSMGAEEVPQEPILTTGPSVGVQISPAKAADLAPDTALLQTDGHVVSTAWHPQDSTLLVTSGETFCSLWKLSKASDPVQNLFLDLKGSGAYVSAVAWDAIGAKLAVASVRDLNGTVTMYNPDGNVVDLLPDLPKMISGLRWAEDSPQLAIVASDDRTSELALWDDKRRPDVFPPPQFIDSHVYDLAWCGRNQVFACGNGAVYQCDVDQTIRLAKTYRSADSEAGWTFIRCIQTDTQSVAVTASHDKLAIWIPTHDILIENAHQDSITAIDIRPQSQAQKGTSTITIASYSTDGTVNVYQVDLESKQYKRVHRLRLGTSLPALAGGFSPDGYALGAVSNDRLFIWNADRGGEPVSTWTAPDSGKIKEEPGHMNGHNGHPATDPDCALSWDFDGKKLAYGFGNQVCAIVNAKKPRDATNSDQMAIVNMQR